MNITEHFTLEELTNTSHRNILNVPTDYVIINLGRLANELEKVRTRLGFPIFISSGYRSPELNELVGGSKTSAHLSGLAADFICPRYGDPLAICKDLINSNIQFDQLIWEYSRWVHFGIAVNNGRKPRRQVLTIHSQAEGYLPGLQAKEVEL